MRIDQIFTQVVATCKTKNLLLGVLICTIHTYAQNGYYFGPQLEIGSLSSTVNHIRSDVNPSGPLIRTKGYPQWAAGIILGKNFNSNDLSFSLLYRQQYLNHTDPNAKYFTNGSSEYDYRASMSAISAQIKYLRAFSVNNSVTLMGGAGLQASFQKQETVTDRVTATGYDPSTLYFEHKLDIGSLGIGAFPEIGIRYQLSKKIQFYFFSRYTFGLSDYAQGNIQRVVLNDVRVDQGEYKTNGSSATAGFSLRYVIHKNEDAKKERLLAKEQRKKENEFRDSTLKADEATANRLKNEKTQDSLNNLLNTNEDTKVVLYDSSGIPKTLDNRTVDKQNEVSVAQTEFELYVWDDKQVDGDSISLYLNGEWILKDFSIQKKKKSIKIILDPEKDNYLIMYALNEGKMPPNTCAVSLNDGTGERRLNLKSTMKSCAAIHFKIKK